MSDIQTNWPKVMLPKGHALGLKFDYIDTGGGQMIFCDIKDASIGEPGSTIVGVSRAVAIALVPYGDAAGMVEHLNKSFGVGQGRKSE